MFAVSWSYDMDIWCMSITGTVWIRLPGHDVRSVTKSFTGALVGIAIAEGKIKSLDQTVGGLLTTHLPRDADPRFARVTVKQLLTMTSGLPGDDHRRAVTRMWNGTEPLNFGPKRAGSLQTRLDGPSIPEPTGTAGSVYWQPLASATGASTMPVTPQLQIFCCSACTSARS